MHHVSPLPPVVWSDDCLRHEPGAEIWLGVRTPGTEVPARAIVLRDAMIGAGAAIVASVRHDDEILGTVHDRALLAHLRGGWAEWVKAGYPDEPGQDRVVPYVFPTAGLLGGLPARVPAAMSARAGLYCYDTMTLVGPGTWEAARAAVDVALTAVDLVVGGAPSSYALCRPPGHHATRAAFGGSCYLNNAAVAAEALRRSGAAARVAVIDIDAHHGNGTQALFYERADVFYGSVHVDPAAGWFPHYVGFADERGTGPGKGTTRNYPLEPGTADGGWLAALAELAGVASGFGPDALVVSLGVDAGATDPESPLAVTTDGFAAAGRELAALSVPTVLVQEGGYDLARLDQDTLAVLTSFGA